MGCVPRRLLPAAAAAAVCVHTAPPSAPSAPCADPAARRGVRAEPAAQHGPGADGHPPRKHHVLWVRCASRQRAADAGAVAGVCAGPGHAFPGCPPIPLLHRPPPIRSKEGAWKLVDFENWAWAGQPADVSYALRYASPEVGGRECVVGAASVPGAAAEGLGLPWECGRAVPSCQRPRQAGTLPCHSLAQTPPPTAPKPCAAACGRHVWRVEHRGRRLHGLVCAGHPGV